MKGKFPIAALAVAFLTAVVCGGPTPSLSFPRDHGSHADAARALAIPRMATQTAIASSARVTAKVWSKTSSAARRSSRLVDTERARRPFEFLRIL